MFRLGVLSIVSQGAGVALMAVGMAGAVRRRERADARMPVSA